MSFDTNSLINAKSAMHAVIKTNKRTEKESISRWLRFLNRPIV